MVKLQKSTVLKLLLNHIDKQRIRAKLINKPFELGVVTDKKPSYIFEVINENFAALEALGMKKYHWQDDALRSSKRISGESLLFSISATR
jgi:hypothetical protein